MRRPGRAPAPLRGRGRFGRRTTQVWTLLGFPRLLSWRVTPPSSPLLQGHSPRENCAPERVGAAQGPKGDSWPLIPPLQCLSPCLGPQIRPSRFPVQDHCSGAVPGPGLPVSLSQFSVLRSEARWSRVGHSPPEPGCSSRLLSLLHLLLCPANALPGTGVGCPPI